MSKLQFELPFPPSVNTYWRSYRGRTILSSRARNYKKIVYTMVNYLSLTENGKQIYKSRLSVDIKFYAPDKRRRDIDNYLKSTLDALQNAQLFEDDYQIDKLRIQRMNEVKDGKLEISITSL